jgi:hypothetical protein
MPSPGEELVSFLQQTPSAEGRELDVAIAYAALMADELRATAADWESAVELLRGMKCRRVAESN